MTLVDDLIQYKHDEFVESVDQLDWEDFKQDNVMDWKESTQNHFFPNGRQSINYRDLAHKVLRMNSFIERTDGSIETQLTGLYLLKFYDYDVTLEGVLGLLSQLDPTLLDRLTAHFKSLCPYLTIDFVLVPYAKGVKAVAQVSQDRLDILNQAVHSANADFLEGDLETSLTVLKMILIDHEIPSALIREIDYVDLSILDIFPDTDPFSRMAYTNDDDPKRMIAPLLFKLIQTPLPVTIEVTE